MKNGDRSIVTGSQKMKLKIPRAKAHIISPKPGHISLRASIR
jgi:hypothetical protein